MTAPKVQHGFYFDPVRCTGCGACVVACQLWNARPASLAWRQVRTLRLGSGTGSRTVHVSLACLHCADPPCVHACPVGALYKRSDDGIVGIEAARCIGCLLCASACPFGAPRLASDGKVEKCTFCGDRPLGTPRACEEVCPHGAIVTGPLEELRSLGVSARVVDHDHIRPSLVLPAVTRP